MIKMNVIACLLLLTSVSHGATIRSNGTGGGKWSGADTWAGGVVPNNGDSVTIVAGDSVIFDIDMSGWQDGIAGLTCDGVMDCSTSAGSYCLKTSADISGIGRIICGSSEEAYPPNCTMTFDFGSKPNSFECGSGLILDLYCIQPTHPVVALSGAEAAGQAQLSVDTDVSGDVWAPGKTVRIDAFSGNLPDSEARVIAVGGIASGTITVDRGLTNAKALGSKVVLVTRNIRIIGSTDYAVKYMTGGALGCEISNCTHGVGSPSGSSLSGTIAGCGSGVAYPSGCIISGTISGCSHGVNQGSGCTIAGAISGCASGASYPSGCMISGIIAGCSYGVNQGSGCVIAGTISGCSYGIYAGSNTIQDAVFGGNNSDLRRVASASAYNTLFGSAMENYEYDTDNVPPWAYVASYGHDGIADAFKEWTRGGVILSDAEIAPPGYVVSYRHMCTSSATPCFRQELITVGPGQTLRVWGEILILDNHDTWPPRLEIVDVREDSLVDVSAVALASATLPAPHGRYYWQDVALSYTNPAATDRQVWIRCSTQQPGDDVYEVWSTELTQAVSQ